MFKKINFYDETLKASNEIQFLKPDLVKSLANDIDIELYFIATSNDPKGYAKAVILVKRSSGTFRYGYDSGRVNNDAETMLQECVDNIKIIWDLNLWRKYAEKQEKQEKSIFGIIKRLFGY